MIKKLYLKWRIKRLYSKLKSLDWFKRFKCEPFFVGRANAKRNLNEYYKKLNKLYHEALILAKKCSEIKEFDLADELKDLAYNIEVNNL